MTKLSDFDLDDAVAHVSMGDGIVVDANDKQIIVRYESKNIRGENHEGIYDKRWFELHPRYMFHRFAVDTTPRSRT